MAEMILTDLQKLVIQQVANDPILHDTFYLSGGTALSAFYLNHRISDDLDFFTINNVDNAYISGWINKINQTLKLPSARFEHLYDRNIYYLQTQPELKVEFTKYPFPELDKKSEFLGIKVDSLRDITANKLFTIVDRNEPKDFIDLYFLLPNLTLEDVVKDAEKKFSVTISPLTLGSELLKVRKMTAFPKLVNPVAQKEIVDFFEKLARQLRPSILI